MAETKRMTAEEVVAYLLEGEGLDFLRESLTWVCQQLMEAEVSELVGARHSERAPEERLAHRNGYRPRASQTRAGPRRCRPDPGGPWRPRLSARASEVRGNRPLARRRRTMNTYVSA